MKSIHDFIVEIPEEFKDYFITKSGVKIYADSRFSPKKTANIIVKVVETPFEYEGEIQPGHNLLIDSSALMRQEHIKTGKHESHHLIDREKRLFKIPKSLVICHSEGEGTAWKGFESNFIAERPEEKEEGLFESDVLIAPKKKKKVRGIAKVRITNPKLEEMGVKELDTICFNEHGAIDIYIRDTPFVWLRNRYVFGTKQ